jgi:DeoR family glycerol-3-phosphate regulon repressor
MLVADCSKLRRSAPVRIAHISQVQTWVTDGLGASPVRDVCHERGVRLIEAAPQFASDDDASASQS